MNLDFYIIKSPIAAPSIALRTVYMVYADPSYYVKKSGTANRDLIALRTIGGIGKVKIEGHEEITVLSGTLLFFKHTDVRRYNCGSENWNFCWFEFSSSEIINIPLNTLLFVDSVEDELTDCRTCLELLQKKDDGSSCMASITLSLLLCKWTLHFEDKAKSNPYNSAVKKVMEYMRLNMNKNISVNDMADMAGLCERRFRQVFISISGIPPKKYIDCLRITMAEELLRNTPFSINEISEKLGYCNQFHFNKAFQRIRNIPPSQFRRLTLTEN